MVKERIDYTAVAVDAAKSVLIELTHILSGYREDIILVGGWIPSLLIPQSPEPHIGSIDVDLALNHRELTEPGYRMMGEILRSHGYEEDEQQPFIFRKTVRGQVVQVDFIAGEYGGTGKSRRTQKALDIQPRKARGCDLAFQVEPATVTIKGRLPDGPLDEVTIRVASGSSAPRKRNALACRKCPSYRRTSIRPERRKSRRFRITRSSSQSNGSRSRSCLSPRLSWASPSITRRRVNSGSAGS